MLVRTYAYILFTISILPLWRLLNYEAHDERVSICKMEPLTTHLDLVTIKCILHTNSPSVHFFLHAICGPGTQTISDYEYFSTSYLRKLVLNKIHYTMQTEAWAFAIVVYNMFAVAHSYVCVKKFKVKKCYRFCYIVQWTI